MPEETTPPGCPPPHDHALMGQIFGEEHMPALRLLHVLRTVTQLMRNLSREGAGSALLSPPRMRLLVHLMIAGQQGQVGLSPSDLSRHLGVSRNTISALLNGLEEQGYIVRTLHPEDRRQFRVQITPAGEALVRESAPRHGALIESLFEPLSAEERAQLLAISERLAEHLAARAAALGLHSPYCESEPADEPTPSG